MQQETPPQEWQLCKLKYLEDGQYYWIKVGDNVGIAWYDKYLKILHPVLLCWDWKGTKTVTHVMKLEKPSK